ncbi:MAG: hypothetical protein R3F29_03185 [Planctomycetota bacterium]
MQITVRRFLAVAALTAVAAPAQTLVVGPGNLPQIRDAIALAAPGDVIAVLPGTYAHFIADKAVTIHALVPGSVHVAYDPAFASPGCPSIFCNDDLTAVRCPGGQTVHLLGLVFDDNEHVGANGTARHRVVVDGGSATFDGCTIRSRAGNALSVTTPLADATLQDCVVEGTGPGSTALWIGAAQATAVGCELRGSPLADASGAVGKGLHLQLGSLSGSGLDVHSGMAAGGGDVALLATQGQCWISDSTFTATDCPVAIGPQSRLARCTQLGGSNCATLPPATLLGATRPAPITPGAPFTVQFRGDANAIVGVLASPGRVVTYTDLLAQPSWLDANGAWFAALLLTDAQGQASVTWPIPGAPGMHYLTLWIAGVTGLGLPLTISPPVGGVAR